MGPKVLGFVHVIYARDPKDYEAQRVAMIEAGKARSADFFMDWNWGLDPSQHETGEPESYPRTRTHEEWVDILAAEEVRAS